MTNRRWVAGLGGVYAKITDKLSPNPYLDIQDRDVVTTSGTKLTLINPAYMLRMIHGLMSDEAGLKAHITSLDPLSPENAPDDWEVRTLKKFQLGMDEVHEEVLVGGEPVLRYMRAMVTEKPCLKCHGKQGYKEGDIRGGISVTVPMSRYYETMGVLQENAVHRYAMIGLSGFGFLWVAVLLLLRHEKLRDVSEANQKAVEEKFRRLVEHSPEIIYSCALFGGGCYYSKRVEEVLGYSPEYLQANSTLWHDSIHPDDKPRVDQALVDAKEGRGFDFEYRIRTATGEWRWLHDRCMHLHNENNELFIDGLAMDITKRKQTDSIYQARLRLLEYATTHSLDELLVATLDEVETLTDSQIGFYHFLEKDQETLSLQAWSSRTVREMCKATGKGMHYPLSDAGVWVDCIKQRQAVIHNDYEQLPHKKGLPPGHAPVVRQLVVPVFRQDKIVAILGVGNKPNYYSNIDVDTVTLMADMAWDIAGRMRTEDELRKSEKRLQEVVAKAPVPMVIVLPNGDIELFNESFTNAFGYTIDDARTGEEWWLTAYPDPEYRQQVQESWERAVEEAQSTGEEIKPQVWDLCRKDGEMRTVEFKLVPLGEISVITMLDLTDHLLLVNDLTASKEQADAANLAKTEFLANMSHEIRTPLNGIMGMLQLMKSTNLSLEQEDYADIAVQSSNRLTGLLSDILDLSMVETGRVELQHVSMSLAHLVDQLQDLFQVSIRQSGLEFRCNVDSDIPQQVMGDPIRLQQILTNLVGNAIKFTNSGSVTVDAHLLSSVHPDQCRVLFSVSDTGIGISDAAIAEMFEPFTQASGGYKRNYQGAGLGLSICKRLVGLMGGTMAVTSEKGVGSSFNVCLSFDMVASLSSEAYKVEKSEGALPTAFRVLVAEDERVNRLTAQKLLEKAGCEVVAVENGQRAIETILEEHFDAVVMDVQMPVMDGVEATKAIRRGEAGEDMVGIPIIAMTAYAMTGDEGKFLEVGMDGYVPKPFDIDVLLGELKRNTTYKRDVGDKS